MLSMLIAYDAGGAVVATLDYMVARDDDGTVIGLIDFEAHEAAGGKLRDIWNVDRAVGSGTWPEWLGARAHDFAVELEDGRSRIAALVHRDTAHRRDRDAVEAAIAERIARSDGSPADIRDLVGGPDRPLLLDDLGQTVSRPKRAAPQLPVIAKG